MRNFTISDEVRDYAAGHGSWGRAWEEAGLRDCIELRIGPALTTLRGLPHEAAAAANDLPIVTQDSDYDPLAIIGGPQVIRI